MKYLFILAALVAGSVAHGGPISLISSQIYVLSSTSNALYGTHSTYQNGVTSEARWVSGSDQFGSVSVMANLNSSATNIAFDYTAEVSLLQAGGTAYGGVLVEHQFRLDSQRYVSFFHEATNPGINDIMSVGGPGIGWSAFSGGPTLLLLPAGDYTFYTTLKSEALVPGDILVSTVRFEMAVVPEAGTTAALFGCALVLLVGLRSMRRR